MLDSHRAILESNEGVFVWIRHGFGRRFGPVLSFCAAIVYYITYVVDLALYATLFFSYFQYLAEDVFTGPLSYYLVVVGLIVIVAG
jgi:amino acid transporter